MNRVSNRLVFAILLSGLLTVISMPAIAAEDSAVKEQPDYVGVTQVSGRGEHQFQGVIVKRDGDELLVRNHLGQEVTFKVSEWTEIQEKKRNPFRRARVFSTAQLMRGLNVEVKGRLDSQQQLTATEIRFTDDELKVAYALENRVSPVEGQLDETVELLEGTINRLEETEQNALRLSEQVEELESASSAARRDARTAQETADQAMGRISQTNERITDLDNFEEAASDSVRFAFGRSDLSVEATQVLDQIAEKAKSSSGYLLEVAGFASSDGNPEFNRMLSQQRAEAVVQYLVEKHEIPLRRIITPYGFGEASPVAENTTREGRMQNRRVEVKLLVNRGLTSDPSQVIASGTDIER